MASALAFRSDLRSGQWSVIANPAVGLTAEIDGVRQNAQGFAEVEIELAVAFVIDGGKISIVLISVGFFLNGFLHRCDTKREFAERIAIFC